MVESHTTVEVGTNSEFKVSDAGEQKRLQGVVYRIADALKTKDYDSVREFFTEDGLKEYELLRLMLTQPSKVFSREELLKSIWGIENIGETRTVDVHIRHIRQKLGDDAHYIETIRGVGYKFNDRQENHL